MRKMPFLFLFALMFFVFTGISCKKCRHCIEKDPAGNVVYDFHEFCGKRSEAESYEAQVRAVMDPGNTIECTDK